MGKDSLYQHPTRSEIIELAVAEGHDADIPSNAGSLGHLPSNSPAPPQKHLRDKDDPEKPAPLFMDKDLEKDLEKGERPESVSSEEEEVVEEVSENDPNVVWWDGPDDPQNPMNWPFPKKWGTVILVSAITFLTPLASSMFAPGVPEVMQTFQSTNDMLQGFMVSVYVLGFAFGPMSMIFLRSMVPEMLIIAVIAPLSEMYGRLPLYHSCNTMFVVFCIAAAVSSNMGMFIVFRFFMGCFGGAPLVLGGGTIADLISREQRGTAMVVWMMGPTVGPCVGPIIGGFLTAARGWRWNFWFVAILVRCSTFPDINFRD